MDKENWKVRHIEVVPGSIFLLGLIAQMKALIKWGTRNRSFPLGEGLEVALVQENIDCSPDIGLFTHRDGTTLNEVYGLYFFSASRSQSRT